MGAAIICLVEKYVSDYYYTYTEELNLERNTQAKGDTPHLSEGVPNKTTLIRLSQGSYSKT